MNNFYKIMGYFYFLGIVFILPSCTCKNIGAAFSTNLSNVKTDSLVLIGEDSRSYPLEHTDEYLIFRTETSVGKTQVQLGYSDYTGSVAISDVYFCGPLRTFGDTGIGCYADTDQLESGEHIQPTESDCSAFIDKKEGTCTASFALDRPIALVAEGGEKFTLKGNLNIKFQISFEPGHEECHLGTGD